MKNKIKKITRIVSALLLIVVINSMWYTYAKYTSSEKGSGQAEVAKWSFEIAKDGEQTKNIQLVNTIDNDSITNGKIGPGTSGTIVFTIDGTGSDVDIEYLVSFKNEKNKPKNIIFTYKGVEYTSLSAINTIHDYILCGEGTKTRDIIILWRWAYETGQSADEIAANDELDTQDATTITEYTFDITATGIQCK